MSPLFCLILLPVAGAALIIAGTHARKTAVTAAALNFLASLMVFGMPANRMPAFNSSVRSGWCPRSGLTSHWERTV